MLTPLKNLTKKLALKVSYRISSVKEKQQFQKSSYTNIAELYSSSHNGIFRVNGNRTLVTQVTLFYIC